MKSQTWRAPLRTSVFFTSMSLPVSFIRLSRAEFDYLRSADFLAPSLVETLQLGVASNSVVVLTLSRDQTEEFRDAFTDRLARVGFNERYETTLEGQMLEGLIDCFLVD